MNLHQGGKSQGGGRLPVFPQLRFGQERRDEEQGVGADGPRLENLPGVDDELLPEDRQGDGRPDGGEIRLASPEEGPVREDGDGRCPVPLVGPGECRQRRIPPGGGPREGERRLTSAMIDGFSPAIAALKSRIG